MTQLRIDWPLGQPYPYVGIFLQLSQMSWNASQQRQQEIDAGFWKATTTILNEFQATR